MTEPPPDPPGQPPAPFVRLDNECVVADWYPEARVLHWRHRFAGGRGAIETRHGEIFYRLRVLLNDDLPYVFLADASGVQSSSTGYRTAASEVLGGHRDRVRVRVWGVNAIIRVTVNLFFRFTALDGLVVRSLEEATASLGLEGWRPHAGEGVTGEGPG